MTRTGNPRRAPGERVGVAPGEGRGARERDAAASPTATPLVEGVLGYEDTVLPQLENALLAGHDVIFLGERGQAKTRMIRSLTGLLDEWMPIVAGSEINDDPYAPVSQHAPDARRRAGRRDPDRVGAPRRRFGEKLATPDTSIADLIGEVDPIKVAEGRYLSDELTIHYGLVPRTNRGIFAINELPDLAERIQVGLLNVLEERDVQIRGYKIRLPARPHAGRVGQPRGLHEPRAASSRRSRTASAPRSARTTRSTSTIEMDVIEQEATTARSPRASRCTCPSSWPRSSPRSASRPAGRRTSTSVRACRCACRSRTTRRSSPTPRRRALRNGETEVVPRVSDLDALVAIAPRARSRSRPSTTGATSRSLDHLVKASVLEAFRARCRPEKLVDLVKAFDEGLVVHTGDDVSAAEYAKVLPDAARRCPRRSPTSRWARRRPASRRRSSSCSRACTSPSASTRTPSARRPPTAAGADPQPLRDCWVFATG